MESPLEEDVIVSPKHTITLTLQRRCRKLLDDSVPYVGTRWTFALVLLVLFSVRIVHVQGWYIVAYALAIYLLNLFIAFLSPRLEPSMQDDDVDAGLVLPTKADEEFRPFVRRLPEFHFWERTTKAVLFSMGCTLFDAFDVPVYWPLLVVYFAVLFALTMKRQIAHMLRYKYLPFTTGKKIYTGVAEFAHGSRE